MTAPAPAPAERLPPQERQKLRAFLDVSANAEELAGYLPSLGEMTEFFRMVRSRVRDGPGLPFGRSECPPGRLAVDGRRLPMHL